jgi:hypothetical protein
VFPIVELNRSVYCLWKSRFIGLQVIFRGIFHKKIPGRSPRVKFGIFWITQLFSSCQPVSIGMLINLIVRIGRTVKKLLMGDFSLKFPDCSPNTNFEKFWRRFVFPLVELDRSVYCLWKSVHWLKSYFGGFVHKKFSVAPLAWNLELSGLSHLSPLVDLNRSVYVHCENRSNG